MRLNLRQLARVLTGLTLIVAAWYLIGGIYDPAAWTIGTIVGVVGFAFLGWAAVVSVRNASSDQPIPRYEDPRRPSLTRWPLAGQVSPGHRED